MSGLYYEQFDVGMKFEHVVRRTVTETDNLLFSALTMNPAALHLDAEYSKTTPFGERIVNSIFTLGLLVGLSVYDTTLGTTLGNLGWEEVKFPRPVLVGESVAAAIGARRPAAEVRAAARAVYADAFVSRLPEGYDTPLARAPMSGGEAQRLGLARAWHARRLMVLDDATSSLDMVTEMQVTAALTGPAPDGPAAGDRARTRLLMTHRAHTAARSDLVVWLESGRVRAVGRHDELWRRPEYRAVFGTSGGDPDGTTAGAPNGTSGGDPDGTSAGKPDA